MKDEEKREKSIRRTGEGEGHIAAKASKEKSLNGGGCPAQDTYEGIAFGIQGIFKTSPKSFTGKTS